jgi:hypothetical protein
VRKLFIIAGLALACSGGAASARDYIVLDAREYLGPLPPRWEAYRAKRERERRTQWFPGRRGAGAAIGDKESYRSGDPSRSDFDAWRYPNNSGYHGD